jgi:hypothetical protein
MENETLNKSLHLHCPKFECYKTIDAKYLGTKSVNGPPIFKLFSAKCESEDECFAVECPVKAKLQNERI